MGPQVGLGFVRRLRQWEGIGIGGAGGGRKNTLFPDWDTSSWVSGKTAQKNCDISLTVLAFLSSLTHCSLLRIQQILTYAGNIVPIWYILKVYVGSDSPMQN